MNRARSFAIAGTPMLLLALSACGGGGSLYGSSNGSSSQSSPTATASGAGLSVRNTSLGPVLVNGQGMTLYMLTSDKPNQSLCDSTCLTYWPPAAALPKGSSPQGVTAQVGSTATTTGQKIVTVHGWPLYTYVEDHAPGDVTGEGVKSFGGVWYALSPSGQPVKSASSGSSGSSSSGYGGRY